jgi:hypothetical protein
MAKVQSAQEVKQQHIAAMGQQLGEMYHALWKELVWLHFKWAEYVALYGKSGERVALLNRAAPFFFAIHQDVAWHDILLNIARFVDPAESMGNKKRTNLTVRALPPLIADNALRASVEDLVAKAIAASSFAVDWRMRRLAHRDLAIALDQAAVPLKPASRLKVKEAREALAAVLNAIDDHYFGSTVAYDAGEGEPDGSITLLQRLRDGVAANEARLQRLRDGTFTEDDVGPREPLD